MSQTRYVSPLRYPGGKASMASWLGEAFARQCSGMPIEMWVEPFAGGAGAGLTLLDRDAVDEVWLVDQNPGIAAFWRAVVDYGEELARRVELTRPTMKLWENCRALLSAPDIATQFDLGYAAFIVNRCSRSGIVNSKVGPIGGKAQNGQWTIASRFTADALADRIRKVSAFGGRLRVFEGDGISFAEDIDEAGVADEAVMFVDPPYIREGNRLYANGMSEAAHRRLADALNGTSARWMLTYDDELIVSEVLYADRRVIPYSIRNSANRSRMAREFAVFSDNFDIGDVPLSGKEPEE